MGQLETDLIKKARDGDRIALGELLERFGPDARRSLADGIPAPFRSVLSTDDVMQQTYADAFVAIAQFQSDQPRSFSAWLTVLAKRNLVDAIRMLSSSKRGGRQFRSTVSREESTDCLCELLIAEQGTPSGIVAKREARSALAAALSGLTEIYRRVVELYDIEGLPVAKVAEVLDRSEGAVYMLRARAHDRLRALMGVPEKYFSDPA